MRSRVRGTRKEPEVFNCTKCIEDLVHGQLGVFVLVRTDGRILARLSGCPVTVILP